MVLKNYVKGEIILAEGTTGDRTYLIRSGQVIICKTVESGNIMPLASLNEGEVFGEMYLFEKNSTRNATAIAATDVTLEVIFQQDLERQLKNLKPDIQLILNGLNQRLMKTSHALIISQRHKSQGNSNTFRRMAVDPGPKQ